MTVILSSVRLPDESRLKIIGSEVRETTHGRRTFLRCRCRCGKKIWVRRNLAVTGHSLSCGCLRRDTASALFKKHGESQTRLYRAWRWIKERCQKKSHRLYRYYGGRGIRLSPQWESYEAFRDYILSLLPSGQLEIPRGLSIDRIDNDGHYEPGNIRIANPTMQARNKRNNRVIEVDGVSRYLAEWEESQGLPSGLISQRLRDGFSEREAVFSPHTYRQRKQS